jgi:ABC-2 type transport system ATP-binding protein
LDSTAALQTSRLTRRFGSHRALHEVDLEIPRGSFFALLGANGAGKTTFLRVVTGLVIPSSGSVRVLGIDPARHPDAVRRRIGYLREEPALYDELAVERLLRIVSGALGGAGAARREDVERQLLRFDLEPLARRRCGQLSRGQRQRVALALAFLGEPELVLLDEPTAGLDPDAREAVHRALSEERDERSFVLCSHDLLEVSTLASQCGLLRAGELVSVGAPAELLRSAWPEGVAGARSRKAPL